MLDLDNRRRRQPKIHAFFTPIGRPAASSPTSILQVSPVIATSSHQPVPGPSSGRPSETRETGPTTARRSDSSLIPGHSQAVYECSRPATTRADAQEAHGGPVAKRPWQDGSRWMQEQLSPTHTQPSEVQLPGQERTADSTDNDQNAAHQRSSAGPRPPVYDKAELQEIRLELREHAEMLRRERPDECVAFIDKFGPGLESDIESEPEVPAPSGYHILQGDHEKATSSARTSSSFPLNSSSQTHSNAYLNDTLDEQFETTNNINIPNLPPRTPTQQNLVSRIKPAYSASLKRITVLDPRCQLQLISPAHIQDFRRLLTSLLPIPYRPTFFQEITDTSSAYSRVAVWDYAGPSSASELVQTRATQSPGLVVGGIKCRLEDIPPDISPNGTPIHHKQLYLQAIGVLAAYREFGIATELILAVIDEAEEKIGLGKGDGRVASMCAHVWETNDWAIAFYEKRGFKKESFVEEYYHKLRPRGAWLMRCPLRSREEAKASTPGGWRLAEHRAAKAKG